VRTPAREVGAVEFRLPMPSHTEPRPGRRPGRVQPGCSPPTRAGRETFTVVNVVPFARPQRTAAFGPPSSSESRLAQRRTRCNQEHSGRTEGRLPQLTNTPRNSRRLLCTLAARKRGPDIIAAAKAQRLQPKLHGGALCVRELCC
jgi:hypothetical protein